MHQRPVAVAAVIFCYTEVLHALLHAPQQLVVHSDVLLHTVNLTVCM